ncbi:MAG: hypothetical protein V4710_16480 [Verrucomicrobiota bacterium]
MKTKQIEIDYIPGNGSIVEGPGAGVGITDGNGGRTLGEDEPAGSNGFVSPTAGGSGEIGTSGFSGGGTK